MIKRMQTLSCTALVAVAMLGGCSGSESGNNSVVAMEPGEWEMTMRVTNVRMDNMPPEMREEMRRMQTSEARTTRDCMTVSADVVRIQNLRFTVPMPGPGTAPGCRIPELSMESGRIRGQMNCDGLPAGGPMGGGGQTMSMSGEMNGTYTANSMDVTARGEMRMGARGGSAEVRFTGRRIGACPAPRPYTPPVVEMPADNSLMLENQMMPAENMAINGM